MFCKTKKRKVRKTVLNESKEILIDAKIQNPDQHSEMCEFKTIFTIHSVNKLKPPIRQLCGAGTS